MFNERKVAQIATWFLRKQTGRMRHLKLMKLMYLADRQALEEHGRPLTGDQVVAMPHGPVLSKTLEYINGCAPSSDDGWEAWISDRENHEVALRERKPGGDQLDELSPAEVEILEIVWKRFGHMNQWQLRDHTHDHCPEWEDPEGSSKPIPYQRIFEVLGRTHEEATDLAESIEEERTIDRLFASL